MKNKVIVAKAVSQHIEEESRKSPEFKKAYDEETARLAACIKDDEGYHCPQFLKTINIDYSRKKSIIN